MLIDDITEDIAVTPPTGGPPLDPSGRPINTLVTANGKDWYQQDGNWIEYAPNKKLRDVADASTTDKIRQALAQPEAKQLGQVRRFGTAPSVASSPIDTVPKATELPAYGGKATASIPGMAAPADAPPVTPSAKATATYGGKTTEIELPASLLGNVAPDANELYNTLSKNPAAAERVKQAPWYKQAWAAGVEKITDSQLAAGAKKFARATGKTINIVNKTAALLTMGAFATAIGVGTWREITKIPADDPDRRKKIARLIAEAVDAIGLPFIAIWLGGALGGILGKATTRSQIGRAFGRAVGAEAAALAAMAWHWDEMPEQEWIDKVADYLVDLLPGASAPAPAPAPAAVKQPWLPELKPQSAPKAAAPSSTSSSGTVGKRTPWLPPLLPKTDGKSADAAPADGAASTQYVEIGPTMNDTNQFYNAQERIFGKKLWEDDAEAKRETYVQQLISSGKAKQLIDQHGVENVIAGIERMFANDENQQLSEDWKGELLAVALGMGAAAVGYDQWMKSGQDTRNIDGQEIAHFSGVPGQKIQPVKIEKHVTVDGKPATVWQGKDKTQHGMVRWYWNYDDEPTMRNPVMKNVMDEDMLIPKGATKAHKHHDAGHEDGSPGIGDLIIMELGDGRAIQARIAELRGNSLVVDLDETAHQWLEESPDHSELMVKGDAISQIGEVWNRMITKLPADTPTGWAAVFRSEQERTGVASRSMPRKWARMWRAQHEALGDSLTRSDALAWADDVEAVLDDMPVNEGSRQHAVKLRKWLDPKDPGMLAVWMASRAGSKGMGVAHFARKTAADAGLPADTYWNKIKNLVKESKHGRRALMRLYDIEPITPVEDDFVIASDVHEYDDNRKLTWNLYKKVVPDADKMTPAYYHVAHLDLSPYGDFTKDQLIAAARDAMKNADVMVDEDDVHREIKPLASIEDILQQVFDSDTDVTLQDKPHGYTAYVLINRPLDGNEELATEQALFRAGYDVDRVQCKDNGIGGIKTNIYLKSKPEADVSEARPDVLGMAESTVDPVSVEKRYYIVRKDSAASPVPGLQGYHQRGEAEKKLNDLPNSDQYMVRAIDSHKLPKDEMSEMDFGSSLYPDREPDQGDEEDLHDALELDDFHRATDIMAGMDRIGMANIKPLLRHYHRPWVRWMKDHLSSDSTHDITDILLALENIKRQGADWPELPSLINVANRRAKIDLKRVIATAKPAAGVSLPRSLPRMDMPGSDVKSSPGRPYKDEMEEAKYQGREVKLGKPIRTNTGEGGKFKVYVRDPKTGNIKMVRFGDTTGLTIKRDDPKRRKNFRARHHCDNPGPRTKARFWSCKMWTKKPVGKILKGK